MYQINSKLFTAINKTSDIDSPNIEGATLLVGGKNVLKIWENCVAKNTKLSHMWYIGFFINMFTIGCIISYNIYNNFLLYSHLSIYSTIIFRINKPMKMFLGHYFIILFIFHHFIYFFNVDFLSYIFFSKHVSVNHVPRIYNKRTNPDEFT